MTRYVSLYLNQTNLFTDLLGLFEDLVDRVELAVEHDAHLAHRLDLLQEGPANGMFFNEKL